MQIKTITFVCVFGLSICNPAYSESQYRPQLVQYQGIEDDKVRKSDGVRRQRGDFKCFVDTNVGEGIYDFSWYVADTQKYIRELPGDRLSNPNVPESVQVYASKVHECVPAMDSFRTERARVLDDNRLL